MANRSEQLDKALQAMLDRRNAKPRRADAELEPLVRIAAELRDLPREGFKARLKQDFQRRKDMASVAEPVAAVQPTVATPYLTCRNAAAAIDFYKRAFGAKEIYRLAEHSGKVGHAQLTIGNSMIYLADEYPDFGALSPETVGGSPVKMHLTVPDVDSFVEHALAEGARLVRPVADQFYGHRSGQVADPFGYTWTVSTPKEELTPEEVADRYEALSKTPPEKGKVNYIRSGFRTVTPYLMVQDAAGLIDFVKQAFGAQEHYRGTGSAGGIHAELQIGDSMVMIGGGGAWKGTPRPTGIHLFVEDADATYQRALAAGATSDHPPRDMEYGERGAGVKDAFGNWWFIGAPFAKSHVLPGQQNVTPYLSAVRTGKLIDFLKKAFGAEEMMRSESPDGVIHHAKVRIGDSIIESSDAHGPYQVLPSTYYLYVPNVDASYGRALEAGARSISEPADQPYGDRVAGVQDPFGHEWYMATHIKDVTS